MSGKKRGSPLLKRALVFGALSLAFGVGGGAAGLAVIARDLPTLRSLEDYAPPVTSHVYDANGHVVARFYEQRRTVVPVERIPAHVKNAFLAAEDAEFYMHEGIDWTAVVASVLNELKVKALGGSRRGGSTITQQTAKTLLLSPEQTYSRKLKEMLLAKRIEEELTKDEILHLYLNQIYFGHGAYGIEEAARTYYGRGVGQLTLGQAASLAAVPKSPSRINPIANPARVRARRAYVLDQMVKHGFATAADATRAKQEAVRVQVEPPEYLDTAPYYAEAVRRNLVERYGEHTVNAGGLKVYAALDARLQVAATVALKDGLRAVDKRQGWRGPLVRLDPDDAKMFRDALEEERRRRFPPEETPELDNGKIEGAPIWDLASLRATELSPYLASGRIQEDSPDEEIDGELLREENEREGGARWPPLRPVKVTHVKPGRIVGGVVTKVDAVEKHAVIDLGTLDAVIPLSGMAWARAFDPEKATRAPKSPTEILRAGDVVLVKIDNVVSGRKDKRGKPLRPWLEGSLEQDPLTEGALVAIDPHSHRVLALVGGYDFERSKFDRASQAWRQPGSSFKPFIYALGIEERRFTPVGYLEGGQTRLITDAPKVFFDRWTGKKWAPKNAGNQFRGDITLRTCLTYSVNTCSLSILEAIGVERVDQLAKVLGLATQEHPLPQNLTLALGTGEVTLLNLVNAYSVFPGGGLHAPPILIEKVKRADGGVLETARPEPAQVLSASTSFVMSDLMKSVVENGTATGAKKLGRVVAGKTGTTNEARSVWFVGFTPDIVAGAYVGFDNNEPLGHREYGGKAALPIWLNFMREAVRDRPDRDFSMPDDVVRRTIDARTGLLVDEVEQRPPPSVEEAPVTESAEAVPDDVVHLEAPEVEEGDLPPGAIVEVFLSGTEPVLSEHEVAPPPLELLEGAGGLGP